MEPVAATDRGTPTPPPAATGASGRSHRRVKNLLLDTSLQLRLASYLIAVALVLSVGLGWLLWEAYRETSRVIALSDREAGDSISMALATEDRWRIVLVSAALAGVLLCLLASAVVITHRIAGPAFAIRRTCHLVAEGHLTRPRPLRDHDLLVDLANEVSGMVDVLRERETFEREVALAAATALRDPAAPAAARATAADALEQLARQKEERLRA